MNGKIVLITGGNSGIGKATAINLAKKGGEIIIACRNESKGKTAVEEIKKASKNDKVSLLICDLSSLKSVRQCADAFQAKYNRLDVLINNAGLMVDAYQTTKDGFEWQFGINHIGHFHLTNCLINELLAANEPRVVTVSSMVHLQGKLDFERFENDKGKYKGMPSYAQSKLANVLFTKGLAKRYPTIKANTLHPGVVGSNFGAGDVVWYIRGIWKFLKPLLLTPEKGAATSIFLASSPDVKVSGKYFDKCKEKPYSKLADDEALVEKLWAYSENAVRGF